MFFVYFLLSVLSLGKSYLEHFEVLCFVLNMSVSPTKLLPEECSWDKVGSVCLGIVGSPTGAGRVASICHRIFIFKAKYNIYFMGL